MFSAATLDDSLKPGQKEIFSATDIFKVILQRYPSLDSSLHTHIFYEENSKKYYLRKHDSIECQEVYPHIVPYKFSIEPLTVEKIKQCTLAPTFFNRANLVRKKQLLFFEGEKVSDKDCFYEIEGQYLVVMPDTTLRPAFTKKEYENIRYYYKKDGKPVPFEAHVFIEQMKDGCQLKWPLDSGCMQEVMSKAKYTFFCKWTAEGLKASQLMLVKENFAPMSSQFPDIIDRAIKDFTWLSPEEHRYIICENGNYFLNKRGNLLDSGVSQTKIPVYFHFQLYRFSFQPLRLSLLHQKKQADDELDFLNFRTKKPVNADLKFLDGEKVPEDAECCYFENYYLVLTEGDILRVAYRAEIYDKLRYVFSKNFHNVPFTAHASIFKKNAKCFLRWPLDSQAKEEQLVTFHSVKKRRFGTIKKYTPPQRELPESSMPEEKSKRVKYSCSFFASNSRQDGASLAGSVSTLSIMVNVPNLHSGSAEVGIRYQTQFIAYHQGLDISPSVSESLTEGSDSSFTLGVDETSADSLHTALPLPPTMVSALKKDLLLLDRMGDNNLPASNKPRKVFSSP